MNQEQQNKVQRILSKKTIGIAGAGGLGSNAAISLARCGIGELIIVDFDTIEKSNLNRQYFFQDQIGQKKVLALKKNIFRVNPDVAVNAIEEKLLKGSMHQHFSEADIIIEALDAAETKSSFIEDILEHLPNIPLIAASGVAGYGNSDRIITRKLENLYVCYDNQAKSSDDDVLLAPKVCLMANWQANIALELLLGDSL